MKIILNGTHHKEIELGNHIPWRLLSGDTLEFPELKMKIVIENPGLYAHCVRNEDGQEIHGIYRLSSGLDFTPQLFLTGKEKPYSVPQEAYYSVKCTMQDDSGNKLTLEGHYRAKDEQEAFEIFSKEFAKSLNPKSPK